MAAKVHIHDVKPATKKMAKAPRTAIYEFLHHLSKANYGFIFMIYLFCLLLWQKCLANVRLQADHTHTQTPRQAKVALDIFHLFRFVVSDTSAEGLSLV